jgi:hypothetical protein
MRISRASVLLGGLLLAGLAMAGDFSINLIPLGSQASPLLYSVDGTLVQTFSATVYDVTGSPIKTDILLTSGNLQNAPGSSSIDVPLATSRQDTVTATVVIAFLDPSNPNGYTQVTRTVTSTFNVVKVSTVTIDGVSGAKKLVKAGDSAECYAEPTPGTDFPAGEPTWSPTDKGTVDPMDPKHFTVNTSETPEKISVTAKCGAYDTGVTVVVVAAKVFLTALGTSGRTPDLAKGECCANAQPAYRTCRWSANILPDGESGEVSIVDGPVSISSGGYPVPSPFKVENGTIFDVIADGSGAGATFKVSLVGGDSDIGTIEAGEIGICFRLDAKEYPVTFADASSSTSSFTRQHSGEPKLMGFFANALKNAPSEVASGIMTMKYEVAPTPYSFSTVNIKCRTRLRASGFGYMTLITAPGKNSYASATFDNQLTISGLTAGNRTIVKRATPKTQSWFNNPIDVPVDVKAELDETDTVYPLGQLVTAEMQPSATLLAGGQGEATTQELLYKPKGKLGGPTVQANGPDSLLLENFEVVP